MHADEVHTDVPLVKRLLRAQFPQWAQFDIKPVVSAGTDNAIYRLGENMAVRLPRIAWAAPQPEKEHRWLARLAPHLPLAIPAPLGVGSPAEGFPWHWSVCPWLDGEEVTIERMADPHECATALARFVAALHRIDPIGGPLAGSHNFGRGVPLAQRDAATRAAIASLHGDIDVVAVTAAWEAALATPAWDGPPVWIHGDLQPGNLLAVGGRLTAVIDFGALGVGDPACDLMVAWNLFSPETRDTFRATLSVDDATWARGRGWALSVGLVALPYYKESNPTLAEIARRAIDQVLADRVPA